MFQSYRLAIFIGLVLVSTLAAEDSGSVYLKMEPLPPMIMSLGPGESGLAKNVVGTTPPNTMTKNAEELATAIEAWRKASSSVEVMRKDGAKQLRGHTGGVTSLGWSFDGKWLASGSEDRTVRLWNPVTGESLHVLEGHAQTVRNVLFSPDSRTVVSGGGFSRSRQMLIPHVIDNDKHQIVPLGLGYAALGTLSPVEAKPSSQELFVWDVATGKKQYQWRTEAPLMMTWFSPNGERCYATDVERNIVAWDVAKGDQVTTWKLPADMMDAMFSPDGKTLYTLSNNEDIVRAWDLDGKETARLKMPALSLARRGILLDISPDGKYVKVELAWKPIQAVQAFNAMRIPAAIAHPFVSEGLFAREGDLFLWELPETRGVYYRNAKDAKLQQSWLLDATNKGAFAFPRR